MKFDSTVENNIKDGVLRPMTREDIDSVVQIEQETFSRPWSKEAFESELNQPNVYYYVWQEKEEIIGYGGFWKILDDANITNIALKKKERGKGKGQKLVAFLKQQAKLLGIKAMTLEVRQSNQSAISVYQKNGFYSVGVRKDYYTKPTEDALIMWTQFYKEDFDELRTKNN